VTYFAIENTILNMVFFKHSMAVACEGNANLLFGF